MKKLVIVESPSKSKTIEKYLGEDYKVVSSKGHIRDLATSGKYGLGVDVDGDFTPSYIPIKGKSATIKELKKLSKDYDKVVLATDPDREGEAISWHLYDTLGLSPENSERVTFHEITKSVIQEVFSAPGTIDMDLVKSQETRRILDRIIGFRLSKLMRSKSGGKSAGRVQSVALKLIVDREREIEAFVPIEYHTIDANFSEFSASLEKYKGEKLEINTEEEAKAILDSLNKEFIVDSIESKERSKKSKFPFKTSTLQATAVNKLGFSSSRTMRVAQKLYEGIDMGRDTSGLITYMRTDSVRLSDLFVSDTFKYIESTYGKNYVGYKKAEKENKNSQDAHECIRPTDITKTPESIKSYLSDDEYKLYSLIYYRTLASLMCDAKVMVTGINFLNNDYIFRTTGSVLVFDGYLKVYAKYEDSEDKILPDLSNTKTLEAESVVSEQHFTKPTARFNESSLIKELESLGIGRPSTYATIIETLKARDYVVLEDKKFIPTEVGILTTDKLQEFFSGIVNVEYTANMESDLDKIAEAKLDNIKLLREFYDKFEPLVLHAFENMEKKELVETGEACPKCGSPMVIRNGRYGDFEACSNYPVCKYIKTEEVEEKVICKCNKCGGDIVEKPTRKGKIFYGCNNYPKCKNAFWDIPVEEECSECGSLKVKTKEGIKCPVCDKKKK